VRRTTTRTTTITLVWTMRWTDDAPGTGSQAPSTVATVSNASQHMDDADGSDHSPSAAPASDIAEHVDGEE